jgi:chromosomal replication initiator protein
MNPRQLEGIEERLVSRFEWGITLPIEKISDPSELLHLLESRLEFYGVYLKKEATDFILSSFSSPATISVAIDQLIKRFNPKPGTMMATEILMPTLEELIEKNERVSLSPQKVLSLVADSFGIKTEDILSKSQSREIVLPRQLSMYLLRKELKMPYIKIGNVFSRDHSTVMSSIKQITKSIESQHKDLYYHLSDIQRKLYNV